MPIVIEQTIQALQAVVQGVPVGTNLALLHLMWTLLNGSFLGSRGAIFPALQASGFGEQESRRQENYVSERLDCKGIEAPRTLSIYASSMLARFSF